MIDIRRFLESLSREYKLLYNLARLTDTLFEDLGTLMISHSILLRMRNVSEKVRRENQNMFWSHNSFPKIVPFMR